MGRIDVHNHFLPGLDDGCRTFAESFACLRLLVEQGYDRVFCTPHTGASEFMWDLSTADVAQGIDLLRRAVAAEKIPIEVRPGGELRLSPEMAEQMRAVGVPTFGHKQKHVLVDTWDESWATWTTRAVEWLQKRGLTVILAHPERMPILRQKPEFIDELARMGLLFQGNLGPVGGADMPEVVALAERYLKAGRYFMLGTDGHRPDTLPQRLAGLKRAVELVGQAAVDELTITRPEKLWT